MPIQNQPWRHEAPPAPTPLPAIDAKAFAADLDALHAELKADLGKLISPISAVTIAQERSSA